MPEPLRAVIADDEPIARRTIRLLLGAHADVVVAAEAGSGAELALVLERGEADLLFLDIELGDLTGFEVLAALDPELLPAIVFTTAYDEFAIRAFEVHAIDYLLKPFTDERFHRAVARAREHLERSSLGQLRERLAHLLAAASPALERLLIREPGRVLFLPVEEIDWLEADDYYVRVHHGGANHLLRKSLTALEGELDGRRFCRVHRSAIVNLERVREIKELERGKSVVRLSDGSEVRLSRSRRANLERAMALAGDQPG